MNRPDARLSLGRPSAIRCDFEVVSLPGIHRHMAPPEHQRFRGPQPGFGEQPEVVFMIHLMGVIQDADAVKAMRQGSRCPYSHRKRNPQHPQGRPGVCSYHGRLLVPRTALVFLRAFLAWWRHHGLLWNRNRDCLDVPHSCVSPQIDFVYRHCVNLAPIEHIEKPGIHVGHRGRGNSN